VISAVGRVFRGPRGRRIASSLEHTAPLARGSSGSVVVDADGAVIGLNTHRLGDGLYLALPTDEALQERLRSLAAGRSRTPRRIGVGLAPSHVARKLRRSVGLPERDGLLVRTVEEGSAAARAGIREGDLLVEAGGLDLGSVDDLHEVLDGLGDGETLTVRVVRGSEELDVRLGFDGDEAEEEGSA
jgi:serine protease Do